MLTDFGHNSSFTQYDYLPTYRPGANCQRRCFWMTAQGSPRFGRGMTGASGAFRDRVPCWTACRTVCRCAVRSRRVASCACEQSWPPWNDDCRLRTSTAFRPCGYACASAGNKAVRSTCHTGCTGAVAHRCGCGRAGAAWKHRQISCHTRCTRTVFRRRGCGGGALRLPVAKTHSCTGGRRIFVSEWLNEDPKCLQLHLAGC